MQRFPPSIKVWKCVHLIEKCWLCFIEMVNPISIRVLKWYRTNCKELRVLYFWIWIMIIVIKLKYFDPAKITTMDLTTSATCLKSPQITVPSIKLEWTWVEQEILMQFWLQWSTMRPFSLIIINKETYRYLKQVPSNISMKFQR